MNIPLYQVDAFTSELFSGNPAAVCLLDSWLEDSVLQAIAQENNLSETAFLLAQGDGFELRWFTPVTEVALCGHATLASALVVFDCMNWPLAEVAFLTRKSGTLRVTKRNNLLVMDFPAISTQPISPPQGLERALGLAPDTSPVGVFRAGEDLMITLSSEQQVRSLQPDISMLTEIEYRGIIVTSAGDNCDFVSRFFAPRCGVAEDPVTGSAHCALIPYWSKILNKPDLHARQLSRRGGELFCQDQGDRVEIAGHARLYLRGEITV
jgi:PhzF family phenazine biosynthesis protein